MDVVWSDNAIGFAACVVCVVLTCAGFLMNGDGPT
jgi:hypothetical protein